MRKMAQFSDMISFSLLMLIPIFFCSDCDGGKVLVVPLEGSHWVNMNVLIKALHDQGHTVDVIRTNNSWYVKENSTYYNSITIHNSKWMDEEFIKEVIHKMINHDRGKSSLLSIVRLHMDMFSSLSKVHGMICEFVTNIFENEEIMKTLKERQYDLILTDPSWGSGILLAHKLQLPVVYNARWTVSSEGYLELVSSPLSYIPMMSGHTDKMTFFQRVKNVFFYMLMDLPSKLFTEPQYQALCDKYFHPPVNFRELLRGADIWQMRVDFVFEFPRPTMPNVIYIGGFQCKPAKTLPQDLEDFMQTSGDHGVIIMSLGAFVSNLPDDVSEEIAAAFAQLPQKVIWRYTGKRPSTLGNNTLLLDWMLQNDLLGHPKTQVFVAHGGTNGVQEALYHGIPVVGIPLFFDQYDNLLRLQEKEGGAKILSIATLDRNILHTAIKEVINKPSYRLSMQKLSHLHRDKPVQPLDSALFWIEFVMRHKGAAHLRTESYKLPWYSYYSVDVAVVLFTVVLIFTLCFLDS